MFDKQRESLEASRNFQKVKAHVTEHREAYIGVAIGGLVVGACMRRPIQIAPSFNNTVAPVITPVFNNTVNNGGYARKIIRCVETDELWPSMSKAAESAGHTLQAMSRHIHGFNDHLDGLHYVIEGVTAS